MKASRLKAVSSRRCSSVRCVFLLPVAGAAAGSLPAYLQGRWQRGQGHQKSPPRHSPTVGSRPRSLPHGLGPVDGGAQPGLDVVVVALVLVLLLAPHQLGVGVLLRLLLQEVEGERGQLRGGRGRDEEGDAARTTGTAKPRPPTLLIVPQP